MITLRSYQKEVRDHALEIYRHLARQLRDLPNAQDRLSAIAHHGGLLLKAPTGSGKTVIAGSIAEELSRTPELKLAWFWFAPFKGLVGQTEASLRDKFPGLRLRDLKADRHAALSESGDTWVATWQSVAASNTDARKVRSGAETAPPIDELIERLREAGFAIGVIVDEAHHGFGKGTQALDFFRQVLRPEFTLLVTATPDDKDAEKFTEAAGFRRLQNLSISRQDAVAAGMIKPGIRSIAFVADQADQAMLVDFEDTAISQGAATHRRIKDGLQASGINLVPLMLVQVNSSKDSVDRAKQNLIKHGFAESQIAIHTADEPDANLLALAVDETKEVLIFKMAVALGFDAPRAFTLVSMRGVVDDDFGTQIVGRILRVHPRCQGKVLPPLLQNAYVFLADCEAQQGLTEAAQKVNQIKTEFAKVSNYGLVVRVGSENHFQVTRNGQTELIPADRFPSFRRDSEDTGFLPVAARTAQENLWELLQDEGEAVADSVPYREPLHSPLAVHVTRVTGSKSFPLKAGVPRQFLTQRTMAATTGLTRNIAQTMRLDDAALLAGIREKISVIRKERDALGGVAEDSIQRIQATLDIRNAEVKAQRMLIEFGVVDPRDLHAELMERLREAYAAQGQSIAQDDDALESALALILVQHPKLLRAAERAALARFAETVSAAPLPENLYADVDLPFSRRNVYGVMPTGMNTWELAFAELLDRDPDGHVLWWHRNEPHRPWSVATTLPNGHQFFPDFIVGIRDRNKPDNVLMVDTKRAINDDLNAKVKSVVEHKAYGRTAILFWEENKRWMTVRYDETRDKNELDAVFRLSAMSGF